MRELFKTQTSGVADVALPVALSGVLTGSAHFSPKQGKPARKKPAAKAKTYQLTGNSRGVGQGNQRRRRHEAAELRGKRGN